MEVKDYLTSFGYTEKQAEEQIKELLDKGELEEFHKNMYIK